MRKGNIMVRNFDLSLKEVSMLFGGDDLCVVEIKKQSDLNNLDESDGKKVLVVDLRKANTSASAYITDILRLMSNKYLSFVVFVDDRCPKKLKAAGFKTLECS